MRTRLHAGRSLTHGEPLRTHIALPHDAFASVVFRHVIRTGQRAVLAPEALIVEMLHDPGDRILLIRIHRTGHHARRIETVMTGCRHMLHHRVCRCPANQQTHVPPRLAFIQTVQRMTRRHARLAARATIEIHVERVLLPRQRSGRRDQTRVIPSLRRCLLVPLGELLDRRQLLLFPQQSLQQRSLVLRRSLHLSRRSLHV